MRQALLLSLAVVMLLSPVLISCNLPGPVPGQGSKPAEPLPSQETFVVAASDSLQKEGADAVCDGTDDQVEIQAAIDAASAVNGQAVLLEGTYSLSSPVLVSANVHLSGSGSTVLDGSALFEKEALVALENSIIENITVDGGTYGGIYIPCPHVKVLNTRFLNIQEPKDGWATAVHIVKASAYDVLIDTIYIYNCDRGIEVEDGAHDVVALNGYIENVPAAGSSPLYSIGAHGHKEEGYAHDVTFRDFTIVNSRGFRAYQNSKNVVFDRIFLFSPTSWAYAIADSTHSIINSYIEQDTATYKKLKAYLTIAGGVLHNTIVKGINGGLESPYVYGNARIDQCLFIGTGFFGLQVSDGNVDIDSCDFSPNPDSPSNYGLRVDGGSVNVTGCLFHGPFATDYSVYQTGGKVNFVGNIVRDRGLRLIGNSRVSGNTLQSGLNYAFGKEVERDDNQVVDEKDIPGFSGGATSP